MTRYRVRLHTPTGDVEFHCPEQSFVLHDALERGIDLPYLCLQGWCVTCAGLLVSGQVDQSASNRYFAADAEAGFCLICTARPRTDLEIVTHQKENMRAHRIAQGFPVPRG